MENDLVKELTIPVYIWSLSDLVDRERLKKTRRTPSALYNLLFMGFSYLRKS